MRNTFLGPSSETTTLLVSMHGCLICATRVVRLFGLLLSALCGHPCAPNTPTKICCVHGSCAFRLCSTTFRPLWPVALCVRHCCTPLHPRPAKMSLGTKDGRVKDTEQLFGSGWFIYVHLCPPQGWGLGRGHKIMRGAEWFWSI